MSTLYDIGLGLVGVRWTALTREAACCAQPAAVLAFVSAAAVPRLCFAHMLCSDPLLRFCLRLVRILAAHVRSLPRCGRSNNTAAAQVVITVAFAWSINSYRQTEEEFSG